MEELARLLSVYKIVGPSNITREIRIMGRRKLRSFLKDLGDFGSARLGESAPQPGQLRLAPAGGFLGLGTASEVVRHLMLYADHLVLRNDLAAMAEEQTVHMEKERDFQRAKENLITELHPFLYQFFLLEPVWRRRMASFVYADAQEHSKKHALSDRVKPLLKRHIRYWIAKNGKPYASLRVGANSYFAVEGVLGMGGTLTHLGPPYPTSTRDTQMPGLWMPIPEAEAEEKDPSPLLDSSHELSAAINEFTSFEVERIERSVRMCLDSDAYFVTDEAADWDIIGALTGVTSGGDPLPQEESPTLAFDIARCLAFVNKVPLETILSLREDMADQFLAFRGSLLRLTHRKRAGTLAGWRREAQLVVNEEVEPAIGQLAEAAKQSSEHYGLTVAGAFIATGVSAMVAWMSGSVLPLLSGLPFLQKVLASAKEYESHKSDEMYFLLKVREQAEEQGRNS